MFTHSIDPTGNPGVWVGGLPFPKGPRHPSTPVTWSTRIREVMMRPYWEKSCSISFCPMALGRPLT